MHFFDTNMLIRGRPFPSDLNGLQKDQAWITETVRSELFAAQDAPPIQEIDSRFQTLFFNDLYRQNPAVCPVYYWYIQSAYNPAIIGGRQFDEEYIRSRTIKGIPLTQEESRLLEKIRRTDPRGASLDPLGRPKTPEFEEMERSHANFIRKLSKSTRDKHPASMNDIRSFCLMMYHMLNTKTDTIFYSGDRDGHSIVLRWLDAVAMRLALQKEVSQRLTPAVKDRLAREQMLEFAVDYYALFKRRQAIFHFLLMTPKDEPGVRLILRGWNWRAEKYEEDYWWTFSKKSAETISRMHGNFWCMNSQNDQNMNWLNITFEPKVQEDDAVVNIKVRSKSLVLWNEFGKTISHQCSCQFREDDASGEMANWTDFIG